MSIRDKAGRGFACSPRKVALFGLVRSGCRCGLYWFMLVCVLLTLATACRSERPAEIKKKEPVVIVKPKHVVLSTPQQAELGFPSDILSNVQISAGSEAEPFFVTVLVHAENFKGEKGFEQEKLAGFSVRTKNSDDLIKSYRAGLRVRGFLIFKSHRGYGTLPDIVTVIRGVNSYDILKIQRTEAPSYNLDTAAIIAWLKQQQKTASFVVTGAGSDWLEAKFVKQPGNLQAFARKIMAFAPDIREYGPRTAESLAERMKKTNEFSLVWD